MIGSGYFRCNIQPKAHVMFSGFSGSIWFISGHSCEVERLRVSRASLDRRSVSGIKNV